MERNNPINMTWKVLIFIFLLGILNAKDPSEVRRFSEPVSKRLSTVEEFYRMYYLPSSATEDDLHRNMFWLQIALRMPFSVPIQALVVPETKAQYDKYQVLMRMHLYFLLTKTALYLAARFDKHRPVFHDKPFKKEILGSLDYARYHYEGARSYWKEVMKHYTAARKMKVRVPLDFLNNMVYRIHTGDLNYNRVAERRLRSLEKKIEFYKKLGK